MRSTVAKLVEAKTYRTGRHSCGVVFGYWSNTDLHGYHWYFNPGVSAGAVATNGGTCAFAAIPSRRFADEIRFDVAAGFRKVLAECDPGLAATIEGAQQVEKFRGFPGQAGYFRQCWGPGWALVGDAGYFKDPLTAHGITDALIDAELLARAAVAGTDSALADYQSSRDERALPLFEVTDAIASFEWDLPAAKKLHISLSTAMNRDMAELVELAASSEA
jgi:2-polyprenyl-6-methoxyphenol hydroxylase-like FAD-dependent oxidoreductase